MACKTCANSERQIPAHATVVRRFLKSRDYEPVAYDEEQDGPQQEE